MAKLQLYIVAVETQPNSGRGHVALRKVFERHIRNFQSEVESGCVRIKKVIKSKLPARTTKWKT